MHAPQTWITEQNQAQPLSPILFGWVLFMVNSGRSTTGFSHQQPLPISLEQEEKKSLNVTWEKVWIRHPRLILEADTLVQVQQSEVSVST